MAREISLPAAGSPPAGAPHHWQIRQQALASMQLVMGDLPDLTRRVPLDVQVLDETREHGLLRRSITFAVEADDRVPALLCIPDRAADVGLGLLCLHQTTAMGKGEPAGLGGSANLHYARELAERGHVTLSVDYPGYGDYHVDPYARGYASATMKGIWNHARGLDLLQSLAQVDDARLGAVGHSLGGHNALFLAAFDTRVRAVVTSCGFNSFLKYRNGRLAEWSHQGYMPRIATVYGNDATRMPFDFTDVLAAIAPRAVFVSAPVGDACFEVDGVVDCVEAALPVYRHLGSGNDLVAVYPHCDHDFPAQTREFAYQFVDRVLATPGAV
jgi:dienelactone hydrolase